MKYPAIYDEWRAARAFLVDHFVCGDFSIPSPEDLAYAIAADEEGCGAEWEPFVSFCIHGEHGLKREYFVSREEIENGEPYGGGLRVIYGDGKPLTIVPLVEAPAGNSVEA